MKKEKHTLGSIAFEKPIAGTDVPKESWKGSQRTEEMDCES